MFTLTKNRHFHFQREAAAGIQPHCATTILSLANFTPTSFMHEPDEEIKWDVSRHELNVNIASSLVNAAQSYTLAKPQGSRGLWNVCDMNTQKSCL